MMAATSPEKGNQTSRLADWRSGPRSTRKIRGLEGYAEVPIIALTANPFASDRDACLAAGMNDHLAKPLQSDELHRTVLQWLRAAAT